MIPGYQSPEKLQPIRTSQIVNILARKARKVGAMFGLEATVKQKRAKEWRIPNRTFQISNGLRSLVTRDVSCNQKRQMTFS